MLQVEISVPDRPGEKSAQGGWKLLCIFTPKALQTHRGDPPPKSGRSKDQARKGKQTVTLTLLDCQAKSCDNSLKPWPLYWELASTAARVPRPCQLVPEPSKWVGGEDGAEDMNDK